jgi:hypothetical protein
VRGCAFSAVAIAVLAGLATTGCLGDGGPGKYAEYQHRAGAVVEIDARLATIPAYPGAQRDLREEHASGYYVGQDELIEAEPYSVSVGYDVPAAATGTSAMRYFRRVLPARAWQCRFQERIRGFLRSFSCLRGHQTIGGSVQDDGDYSLGVQASNVVPPIEIVDQVE